MMITDLEAITKTRYKVYLDEEFAFVLTKTDLFHLQLEKCSSITDAVYDKIMNEILLKRAKLKALNLLKARDYTESGLRDKLKADYYPPLLIDRALEYVKSYNYINDERFIDNFCRLNKDNMSRQMLIYKLRQKGVPSELIDSYMSDFKIDGHSQILRILQSKYDSRLFDKLSDPKEKQKIMSFLLRKGYSYSEIRGALKSIEEI